MSNHTVGRNRNPGDTGDGWTGVTYDDKRWASGQAPLGAGPDARARIAVQNTEDVAKAWGSGHWSGQRGTS